MVSERLQRKFSGPPDGCVKPEIVNLLIEKWVIAMFSRYLSRLHIRINAWSSARSDRSSRGWQVL